MRIYQMSEKFQSFACCGWQCSHAALSNFHPTIVARYTHPQFSNSNGSTTLFGAERSILLSKYEDDYSDSGLNMKINHQTEGKEWALIEQK